MNTLETILKRSSCREYTDKQITDEELNKILIAANAAPVGMAQYEDVALTVIQDKKVLDKIEENSCKLMPNIPNKHPLYNANTCILVSVKQDKEPVAEMLNLSASCIMENMLIEATELGLGSTYLMGVIASMKQNAELCKEVKVPDGFIPVSMVAVGYSAKGRTKKQGRNNF